MKRVFGFGVLLFGGLLFSSIGFSQEVSITSGTGLWAIGSGLAMGLSALGGTLSQGKAAAAALEGLSRNPGAKSEVFTPMILALALIEFQAILGFVIALLWFSK